MLVAIKVGKPYACLLKALDLRRDLALDLIPIDASEKGASEKFATRARKPPRFINQGRQDLVSEDGSLFHQRQMQANIQLRILSHQCDSLLKCAPRHEQRGTRHDAVLKRPQDPSIDSSRQSQVIRVNNQLFQGAEIRAAARISCRIFIRNLTSSRIILKITSGLARVDVPRFLGK
jgi:hypothetical protein